MQRMCGSMSAAFNSKYKESGSLFQGSYKSRTVDDDLYLRYLFFYIHVKNVMELYPGGLTNAIKQFNHAWEWALQYPYTSFRNYAANEPSPILDIDLLKGMFPHSNTMKKEVREMLVTHMSHHDEKYSALALEPW